MKSATVQTTKTWKKVVAVLVSISLVLGMANMRAYAVASEHTDATGFNDQVNEQTVTSDQKAADQGAAASAQQASRATQADTGSNAALSQEGTAGQSADQAGQSGQSADQQTPGADQQTPSSDNPEAKPAADDQKKDEAKGEEGAKAEDAVPVTADVSNPAFEGYAYVDGVTIKVTAPEGALPEGTSVKAVKVDRADVKAAIEAAAAAKDKETKSQFAVDITLVGKDGKEIQPNGAVNICFFNANIHGDEITVKRVSDDASRVENIPARQTDSRV